MGGLLRAGMQETRINVATKIAGCEEARCEWFLHGKEGEDEGAPFRHPAGVECGDHQGCPDPNCPCPQRLAWELNPYTGKATGRRGHKIQDHEKPPLYTVNAGVGARAVTPDEWLTRLHEGTDATTFIRTRGL